MASIPGQGSDDKVLPVIVSIRSGGGLCGFSGGCWASVSVSEDGRVVLEDAVGLVQGVLTEAERSEYHDMAASPLFEDLVSASGWKCPQGFDSTGSISVTWSDGRQDVHQNASGCLQAGVRSGTVLSRLSYFFSRLKHSYRDCPAGTGSGATRYLCL